MGLSSHFGNLTDLEQKMGQWSLVLRSGTLTSVITSGLFSGLRVADVWGLNYESGLNGSVKTLTYRHRRWSILLGIY